LPEGAPKVFHGRIPMPHLGQRLLGERMLDDGATFHR